MGSRSVRTFSYHQSSSLQCFMAGQKKRKYKPNQTNHGQTSCSTTFPAEEISRVEAVWMSFIQRPLTSPCKEPPSPLAPQSLFVFHPA